MSTVESYKKNLDSSSVWSVKNMLALGLRAADYYGIAGPTNARFSASLPGRSDVLLIHLSEGWANAKAENVVAVDSDGLRLDGVGRVDRAMVEAHFGMHAASGRDWVLHVYSHHVVESATNGSRGFADALLRLSRRDAERTVQNHSYGDARVVGEVSAPAPAPASKVGAEILLLANSGVGVCGNTLEHAFDDLYHLERALLANYLSLTSDLEPARLSGELSSLLRAQYTTQKSQYGFVGISEITV